MQYLEITGNGTFTVKSGPGFFQGVMVNLPGSATIRIFDNVAASGAAIAGGGAAFAVPAAGTYMRYEAHFTAGLTIVIASMTTGSITVSYY